MYTKAAAQGPAQHTDAEASLQGALHRELQHRSGCYWDTHPYPAAFFRFLKRPL